MDIAIVGGGIYGLSLAWALARNGYLATVIEKEDIPNESGASFDQHRLLHPFFAEKSSSVMWPEVMGAWQTMCHDIGEDLFVPSEAMIIATDRQDMALAAVRSLTLRDIAFAQLDARDTQELLPQFVVERHWWSVRTSGSILLANRILPKLVRCIRGMGVSLRPRTKVCGFDVERRRINLGAEFLSVDLVICAAGPWMSALAPTILHELAPHRQISCYLEAPARWREAWVQSPAIIDAGLRDELWFVPPVAGTDLKVASGQNRARGNPDLQTQVAAKEVKIVQEAAAKVLRDAAEYRVLRASSCYFGSHDGAILSGPVIGGDSWLWVLGGCSGKGYKFAPAIALATARSISSGNVDIEMVDIVRPVQATL
jgi:glycine/D-amino acid oxidase-like deaminating enzyme